MERTFLSFVKKDENVPMQTKGVFVCFLNDGIGPITCHVMRSAVINDVKHIILR